MSQLGNEPVLIKNFLPPETIEKICEFTDFLVESQRCLNGDTQAPFSDVYAGQDFLNMIGYQLTPEVEKITGKNLYPTYVYGRTYHPGSELVPHVDRQSCGVSITVCLKKESKDIKWPLHVKYEEETKSFEMEPGDGIVYWGIEQEHWRDLLEGGWVTQMFFHYEDIDSPSFQNLLSNYPRLTQVKMFDINKLDGRPIIQPTGMSPYFIKHFDGSRKFLWEYNGVELPENEPNLIHHRESH